MNFKIRTRFAYLANSACLVIVGTPASTSAQGRATVRAIRLAEGLRLDGQLDELVYQTVPAITDFVRQIPFGAAPATEKTEAWVMFDRATIYVGGVWWTVEMAIPFKSPRFRPGPARVWGLQLRRGARRKNETSYLTPMPIALGRGTVFRVSAAAMMAGLEVPDDANNLRKQS